MTELEQDHKQKNTFWRNWGAVFILLILFFASWVGQFASQLITERNDAAVHSQPFQMSEFWPKFFSSTFENWQSEWLQLTTQAVLISGLSAVLFRKQDEEHYKTQLMIEDLRQQLQTKTKH